MATFVTLSCPTCGGKLRITPDLDRFACEYCGREHIVKRRGGVVSLKPIQEGVTKTASELAIVRLKEEIGQLEFELMRVSEAKTTAPLSYACLPIIVFLAVVALGIYLGSTTQSGILVAASFIAAVALLVILGRPGREFEQQAAARKAEKMKALKEKIAAKQKALKRHRDVVAE